MNWLIGYFLFAGFIIACATCYHFGRKSGYAEGTNRAQSTATRLVTKRYTMRKER